MPGAPRFCLNSHGATQLLLASLAFAPIASLGVPAHSADDAIEAPADTEQQVETAPGSEDGRIEPDESAPDALMRPDLKGGGEGTPPPHSAQENKQDKLNPSIGNLPLQTPLDRPKVLGELYEQLGKASSAEAAAPIMSAIENLWRVSGSDTVDLLMARAERFAKEKDLDLALKILDATLDIAPEEAEAWHLRAKVHYLQKDYELAIADLKRALDRDPNHYDAMNDLGIAYEAIGDKKQALESYRKALAVNPFFSETKRSVEKLRREIEGQDI